MNGAPSSTWFTLAPHWQWLVIFYFFLGGLAGGSYFLATVIDLFGRPQDRPLARLGYYVAFPLVIVCGLLLIVDLSRPLRFWHMLIERNTFEPMFKYWSPMSIGSWALLIFGFFSFLSFLGALGEDDHVRWSAARRVRDSWPGLRALRPESVLGKIITVLGGMAGLYVAGYTGVLLAVTNRPIWSDTPLLGMLFIVSAASTSAALLIVLALRYGWNLPGVVDLHRMDLWVIVLELVVLAALLISLGPVLVAWLNVWGLLLLIGVIIGLLVPLVVGWRPQRYRMSLVTTSMLVLIGGFLLRAVIVLSSETL